MTDKDKLFTCVDCSEDFSDTSEMTLMDDRFLCQDCLDEYYINCNDCNEVIHNDDSYLTVDEVYICKECRDRNYFICNDCSGLANDAFTNEDVSVCLSCRDDHYSICEDCEGMTHYDNMRGNYCGYCVENRDEDDCDCGNCRSHGIIHHYGYKPELNFHKTLEEKENSLYFGIELEMESREGNCDEQAKTLINLNGNEDEKLFFLAFDGTINRGFEIITHPASVK